MYAGPALTKRRDIKLLQARATRARSLVLTYDDGPGPALTPLLLDMLKGHGATATFFLLGRRTPGQAELLERMRREGHELGCHTSQHLHAWKVAPAKAIADINTGYADLSAWVPPAAVFRPPYGKVIGPTTTALRRRGAPLGWWTVDSGDTAERLTTEPQLAARAVAQHGGGVVLLHDFDREVDAPVRSRFVLEATAALLDTAAAMNLRIRTLGSLLEDPA